VFAAVSQVHPSLEFAGKVGVYQSGAPYGTQLYCLAPSLAHKYLIRVEKSLTVAITLAYSIMAKNTAVKGFIVQALGIVNLTVMVIVKWHQQYLTFLPFAVWESKLVCF
jgi:hypothetical protein